MKIKIKLFSVVLLAFTLITTGIIGYMSIGNYTFIEAFYMTVITVSTVGFGEVHPSSDTEKLFTIFLILTSIGIFAYIVSVITEYIANGKLLEELKIKKMQIKINKLQNHAIVCGYGRNGRQAALKLKNHGKTCVIIEGDLNMANEIEKAGFLYVIGNATDDEVLIRSGIKKASTLIVTLPSDADNLFVILSARQYNQDATLISRASNDSSERKLRIAGANNVIMPDKLGGDHMASLVVSPNIIEFIDRLSLSVDCDTNLEAIDVNRLPKEFINKTLLDLDLRKKTGCSIIGVKTTDNDYIINPDTDVKLSPNSKLIVLGNAEQINLLKELY